MTQPSPRVVCSSELNVEAILQQVRSGNVQPFSEIVRRYYASIRWFVFARCPLGGDPEGVVQRVFLAAFQEIDQYQPGTDFQAWIFTLARFEVMTESSRVRRESKNRGQLARLALAETVERASLDEEPENAAWLNALKNCLGELNPSHRELVRLRYEEGERLQDMTARTNRSVGALKKTFFAIRGRLRQCIERRTTLEES
jgi:RNA polymerase sigma-70 factor, ECF subfamily